MVTADSKVWDSYIKLYPYARSCRIKTFPYYNDLCKIYTYTNTEVKDKVSCQIFASDDSACVPSPLATSNDKQISQNWVEQSPDSYGNVAIEIADTNSGGELSVEALHDIMIDEDYGITVSERTVNDTLQHAADISSVVLGTRSRTYWQPPMDRYFIDLMLDQLQKGNQVDGQFRKEAWREMMVSFNNRFGSKYDIDILRNRYKTLKRQYNVINNLLKLDGFDWDDQRRMVTADDCVWQDYIKTHTDVRQYMTRPVPYFKDLCVICKDLNADGSDGVLSQNLDQRDEDLVVKLSMTAKESHSADASGSGELQSAHISPKNAMFDQRNKRSMEDTHSPHSKRAKGWEEGTTDPLRETAAADVHWLAGKNNDENSNAVSIEVVVGAIQALPDMDEDLVLDACDLLEDEKKAKTFLALDFRLRRKWLVRKLRPQSQ